MLVIKIINYDDLTFVGNEKTDKKGSFGKIQKCMYNGKTYALKTFNNNKYLDGKRKKIDMLSDINNSNLITPKFWVKKEGNKDRYISEFYAGESIASIQYSFTPTKIKILKSLKNVILSMHKENIIHSDLISSNIILGDKGPKIIDFDNCSFNQFKTNINDTNDFVKEFIKIYGIRPELDIHIFNLLTFSIINNVEFYLTRSKISNNQYGFFYEKEGKKICNSLFLDSTFPNNDFLIDTLDETSFKV